MQKTKRIWIAFIFAITLTLCGCSKQEERNISISQEVNTQKKAHEQSKEQTSQEQQSEEPVIDLSNIPAYNGQPYIALNDNNPMFADADMITTSYEVYSNLDSMGRCGVASANIGQDLMPTEDRGAIGQVKPSGWHTVKYDCVDGKYLYNRCHLIGYQLTAENANTINLITGTRYLNVEGMLPFENMVADYIQETGNHVLYRVTPLYEGSNLVASGVQMEAKSVEDNGEGILFNVYVYNVQPGVEIDYATGNSKLADGQAAEQSEPIPEQLTEESDTMVWISATGSKYHSDNDCGRMNPENATQITEEDAIGQGMEKCSKCW